MAASGWDSGPGFAREAAPQHGHSQADDQEREHDRGPDLDDVQAVQQEEDTGWPSRSTCLASREPTWE